MQCMYLCRQQAHSVHPLCIFVVGNEYAGSKSGCEFHDAYKLCPANIQIHNIEMPEG